VKKEKLINQIKDEFGQSVHIMGRNRRTEGVEYTVELKERFNDIQRQNMVTRISGKTELNIL
jgi:hypothetical protein